MASGCGPWSRKGRASSSGSAASSTYPTAPRSRFSTRSTRPYWGRGLASEAGAAALRYGFEVARLERIVAVALPEHAASQRVMKKLGMTYEGLVEVYGGIRAVLYAVSRQEFMRRATNASSAGGNA